MSRFSIQNAFTNCLPLLDSGIAIEESVGFFFRQFDPSCCAWDRGFFLQLNLVECDFSKHGLDMNDLSHLAITADAGRIQNVKRLDGKVTEYPVIDFTLYINREVFNPQHQDDTLSVFRARCIAHELLIVEKYANTLGVGGPLPEFPEIDPPDGKDEDAVLCPYERIEETLITIETVFGVKLNTAAQIIAMLPTPAGKAFRDGWLKASVDQQTCVERTILYLSLVNRASLKPTTISIVSQIAQEFYLTGVPHQQLMFKVKTNPAIHKALVEHARVQIGEFVTEAYVCYLASKYLV
jgi:hypothetical protein